MNKIMKKAQIGQPPVGGGWGMCIFYAFQIVFRDGCVLVNDDNAKIFSFARIAVQSCGLDLYLTLSSPAADCFFALTTE